MFDSDEKTEKAAVTFLKWLSDDSQNIRFSAASGYLPVKKSANDMEQIEACLKEQGEELSPKMSAMLNTAIPQVNQYGLYTAKPFDHAYDARQVIDMTMPEVAAQNRAQVQALLDQGVSLEEAAAQYDTDEIFKQWYDDTESQLANLAE